MLIMYIQVFWFEGVCICTDRMHVQFIKFPLKVGSELLCFCLCLMNIACFLLP